MAIDVEPWTPTDSAGSTRRRIVPSRKRTPNGRSILGGLLVAVAALGFAIAADRASAPPSSTYVVATQPIAAGDTVTPQMLGLAPLDLVDLVAETAITNPDDVIGRVATRSMSKGHLVTQSDTSRADEEISTRTVSLELPTPDAAGGTTSSGDRVDIAVSNGTIGSTEIIASNVLVVGTGDDENASLGSDANVTVRLRVADAESARHLIDAHRSGQVTLIATDQPSADVTPANVRSWTAPPAPKEATP